MDQQDRVVERRRQAEERRGHWRGVIDTWRGSGLSKAAFCREHGIGIWQFYYWAQRLGELDADRAVAFARVSTAESGLRLVLPGGVRLEIEAGFDPATLRRVLAVLAAPC